MHEKTPAQLWPVNELTISVPTAQMIRKAMEELAEQLAERQHSPEHTAQLRAQLRKAFRGLRKSHRLTVSTSSSSGTPQ